jgi:hypothetical protein
METKVILFKFNVFGSVHLGNKCFYSSPTESTISYVFETFISSTCFGRHSIHHQKHNCSFYSQGLSVEKPMAVNTTINVSKT